MSATLAPNLRKIICHDLLTIDEKDNEKTDEEIHSMRNQMKILQ